MDHDPDNPPQCIVRLPVLIHKGAAIAGGAAGS